MSIMNEEYVKVITTKFTNYVDKSYPHPDYVEIAKIAQKYDSCTHSDIYNNIWII